MSRAQSAQECTSHGCATGKKKPNPKVRFSLLVVELRGVALQREHIKSRHIMLYIVCASVQPVAAQSAQGCILLGAATGKKKPNQRVRFSLLVVELRGVEPLSEKL